MKHFLGLCMACTLSFVLQAQYSLQGKVTSEDKPVEAATVILQKDNYKQQTLTGVDGSFVFTDLATAGTYTLSVLHMTMQPAERRVTITKPSQVLNIPLYNKFYYLEPLEVRSLRAGDRAPFTKTNISQQELAKNNLGQDLPFLLNQTPGIVVNSDAGNGVGYTGLRIRGSDATRINMTINGIPYNDPESQGTFLVNLPDLASSVQSIQIQRGVGTSSNGAGSFGGTLNLNTNQFNEKAYAEINNSVGTFNTWKHTVKSGSGLINNHFTVDARLSKISSDGYIDRASTNLHSFYMSAAYLNDRSSLRFNVFSGKEKTYQAWYGVPENLLTTNRTFNAAGTEKPGDPYENETDNYQQNHYQLFFNHKFSTLLSFNTAIFMIRGAGYYEQYKADEKFTDYGLSNPFVNGTEIKRSDLVRQLWLDNNFYGQIFSFQYNKNKNQLTAGGGWNMYKGNHFGKIIWAQTSIPKDYRWYNTDAFKADKNVYVKWQHELTSAFELFTDIQYRHVDYTINGFRNNPTVAIDRKFDFVNPKAGIAYHLGSIQAYASYALANKEPNRDDFEAGITQQPIHETLHDFELGFEQKKHNYSYGITAYYMRYKNQLILTGQINDVGAYTRANIPNSYRTGIEVQGTATFTKWMNAAANIALSRNNIKSSNEFIDDYDNGGQLKFAHNNTDIAFSPAIVSAATLNIIPIKNAEISLVGKYVSRQYLDNTSNDNRSLSSYYVQDFRLAYTLQNKLFHTWKIIAAVNNVFNKKYAPNGYTFSYLYNGLQTTENYYYPMAGTNAMAGINITL